MRAFNIFLCVFLTMAIPARLLEGTSLKVDPFFVSEGGWAAWRLGGRGRRVVCRDSVNSSSKDTSNNLLNYRSYARACQIGILGFSRFFRQDLYVGAGGGESPIRHGSLFDIGGYRASALLVSSHFLFLHCWSERRA